MKARCEVCDHRNPSGSRYCRECGRALEAPLTGNEARSLPGYGRSPLARMAWATLAVVAGLVAYLLGLGSR